MKAKLHVSTIDVAANQVRSSRHGNFVRQYDHNKVYEKEVIPSDNRGFSCSHCLAT